MLVQDLHILLNHVEIREHRDGMGVVRRVIPYVKAVADLGPVRQVLHEFLVAFCVEGMGEAAEDGAQPHDDVVPRNDVFRRGLRIRIGEGIDRHVVVSGGLYGVGYLIHKIEHGCGMLAAVLSLKGGAGVALAAGIVVILRDGNDLQRRGGVMLLRQKVQYVFRADSEHLRICKTWLVRCAYAVVERQVFRVRFGIFPRFAKPAHGMAKPADIIHGVAHFRPQRPVLAAVQPVGHGIRRVAGAVPVGVRILKKWFVDYVGVRGDRDPVVLRADDDILGIDLAAAVFLQETVGAGLQAALCRAGDMDIPVQRRDPVAVIGNLRHVCTGGAAHRNITVFGGADGRDLHAQGLRQPTAQRFGGVGFIGRRRFRKQDRPGSVDDDTAGSGGHGKAAAEQAENQ